MSVAIHATSAAAPARYGSGARKGHCRASAKRIVATVYMPSQAERAGDRQQGRGRGAHLTKALRAHALAASFLFLSGLCAAGVAAEGAVPASRELGRLRAGGAQDLARRVVASDRRQGAVPGRRLIGVRTGYQIWSAEGTSGPLTEAERRRVRRLLDRLLGLRTRPRRNTSRGTTWGVATDWHDGSGVRTRWTMPASTVRSSDGSRTRAWCISTSCSMACFRPARCHRRPEPTAREFITEAAERRSAHVCLNGAVRSYMDVSDPWELSRSIRRDACAAPLRRRAESEAAPASGWLRSHPVGRAGSRRTELGEEVTWA